MARARVLVSTKSKIDNLDDRVLVSALEQEILGFEVSVADVLCVVAVVNSFDDVLDDLGSIVFREVALSRLGLGDDAVEELSSGAELRDEVEVLFVLIDLVEFYDIRVFDLFVVRDERLKLGGV